MGTEAFWVPVVIGAGVGAGTAAATGGDPIKGAAFGAIGGGIGGAVAGGTAGAATAGAATTGATTGGISATGGAVIGGIAGSSIGSALTQKSDIPGAAIATSPQKKKTAAPARQLSGTAKKNKRLAAAFQPRGFGASPKLGKPGLLGATGLGA